MVLVPHHSPVVQLALLLALWPLVSRAVPGMGLEDLLRNMFYFPFLVLKRNLSLLDIFFDFSRGLNQMEVIQH